MRIAGPVEELIRKSLEEDLGPGDLTTEITVPEHALCSAEIHSKADGVLAGIVIPGIIFRLIDERVLYEIRCSDGAPISKGQVLAEIKGPARAILTGERTSLNFLQHLSGIATITRSIVDQLRTSSIDLLDTRKTIPGMRLLEKYAVATGGGKNHRLGLYDGILIKNNHLRFSSVRDAVTKAKQKAPPFTKVEVEVENLDQLEEALQAGADIIMLDNMDVALMKKALERIAGRAKVEVSGNITEENIPCLRELSIDYISMGRLTHSAKALDMSLRISSIEA